MAFDKVHCHRPIVEPNTRCPHPWSAKFVRAGKARAKAPLHDPGGHVAGRAGADHGDGDIQRQDPEADDRGDRHRDVEAHRGAGDHQRKGGADEGRAAPEDLSAVTPDGAGRRSGGRMTTLPQRIKPSVRVRLPCTVRSFRTVNRPSVATAPPSTKSWRNFFPIAPLSVPLRSDTSEEFVSLGLKLDEPMVLLLSRLTSGRRCGMTL